MKHYRITLGWKSAIIAAALLPSLLLAKPWWVGAQSNEADFLPPDVAFKVSSRIDGDQVHVRWVIADGYYLYRQRMEIKAESPGLVVATPEFPRGMAKTDPYLGTQEIYQQQVEASARFTRSDFGAHPMQIKVTYQGCAEAGLCYPPIIKVLSPVTGPVVDVAGPGGILPRHSVAEHPWEGWAIGAGALAFLSAGLLLRKGRRLTTPAP
jgi:thiol:disulfide interchange protein DsbD